MAAIPWTGGAHFRRPRWGRWCVLAASLVLLFAYVGSYYHLSRRGIREAKQYQMRGFLYVPLEEVLKTQDLNRHYGFVQFYAPVNWIDREVFGTEGPTSCILFGLSK